MATKKKRLTQTLTTTSDNETIEIDKRIYDKILKDKTIDILSVTINSDGMEIRYKTSLGHGYMFFNNLKK